MASVLEAQKMDEEWVIELKRLEDYSSTMVDRQVKKRSIYKVPPHVTNLNKNAYRPQVVSFGPYHHGEKHLMPMEEHKHRALFHFLKRTNMALQIIVDNLTKVVQDLKDSYDLLGDVWQLDTRRFLKLMVLDGCFMLEVLYYYTGTPLANPVNYAPNDLIFSAHGRLHVMPYIRRDMLLLENQLPMLVLTELVGAMDRENTQSWGAEEVVKTLIGRFTNTICPVIGECLHVLGTFRNGVLWSSPKEKREGPIALYDERQITLSAMELQDAGISFKIRKFGFPDEISFKDKVLCLPVLVVDDTTESMFLNLIAFERLHVGTGNGVTSYIFFMGAIINNVRDVRLLKSNGIIETAIGSEEVIVELFKSLSKGTKLEPGSNPDVAHTEIREYRRKPWNQFRANFIHAYHTSTQWNPWAYWSIIFAILLFTLTLVQTAYTISPYYRPNK
ncbi:UPF0481 protein [Actinidia chinensis var. chinensis]|uniref:UPF0481 protein n=1 Tax=Actinidia chinensis var. chinensis TaxID=1590841 RepID=A0A2R6P838_ACTCC|nr:UPF0481 protein [Actinidia chinensis var. chinensis]